MGVFQRFLRFNKTRIIFLSACLQKGLDYIEYMKEERLIKFVLPLPDRITFVNKAEFEMENIVGRICVKITNKGMHYLEENCNR